MGSTSNDTALETDHDFDRCSCCAWRGSQRQVICCDNSARNPAHWVLRISGRPFVETRLHSVGREPGGCPVKRRGMEMARARRTLATRAAATHSVLRCSTKKRHLKPKPVTVVLCAMYNNKLTMMTQEVTLHRTCHCALCYRGSLREAIILECPVLYRLFDMCVVAAMSSVMIRSFAGLASWVHIFDSHLAC